MILFVINNSDLDIETSDIEPQRLDKELNYDHQRTKVIYMAGPLFFGNQEQIITKVNEILNECNNIIFSMRGVPSIDDSGIREFIDVVELCRQNNINVLFAGVQKNVMKQFKRHHFVELEQPNNFCWDVIKALDKIEQKG